MRGFSGILIAVLIVAKPAWGFECRQNEAQFFGVVSKMRTHRLEPNVLACYIGIQFTEFKPSQVCPMDEMAASRADILVDSDGCENVFRVGDEISGYLVETPSGQFYFER